MPDTLAPEARELLAGIAADSPEWRPWTTLLEEALRSAADPSSSSLVVELPDAHPPSAPLLDGATVLLDARAANRRLSRLLASAAESKSGAESASLGRAARRKDLDALTLIEASFRQDGEAVAGIAEQLGVEPGSLGSIAALAALPLLLTCGERLRKHVSAQWSEGYCPICGAWPTLAEMRGLERARRLRCGRCAGDWAAPILQCPYCRTSDHRVLGSLLTEDLGDSRKVDVCDSCRGYVKTLTTLSPWPAYRVPIEDLATVDLDVIALERDYLRPAPPGYPVNVTVAPATPTRRGLFRRRP